MGLNLRAVALMFLVFLVAALWMGQVRSSQVGEVKYSTFLKAVERGEIRQAVIAGVYVVAVDIHGREVRTRAVDPDHLRRVMEAHGVQLGYVPAPGRSWFWQLAISLIPSLLLITYLFYLSRHLGGGSQALQFGRSRARLYTPDENRVGFGDVAGVAEAKEELQEVVDFLRQPQWYQQLGARIPKGVLLTGPPGVGKTLLARAVAGEAGVPFFHISGSDFVELFAGVGAARVRDLFAQARQAAPCIIFIDEIDAVGRHRGLGLGGANDEREQTLNQLLVELDGFGPTEGIIVIAATNRVDVLDPALLRPGRFDRIIHLDPPDRRGRQEILEVHARGKRLEAGVDLGQLAGLTVGFTGADLANLLNEAALLAARRRKNAIGMAELEAAFERMVAGGPERRWLMNPRERERVAFHEAGHAVVSRKLAHSDPIQKVSIIPRGRAGGYVLFRKEADKLTFTRAEMLDTITGILAGRAAEEVALGNVSNGAANDLERATDLARRMVTEWGMSEQLGPVRVGSGHPAMPLFGAALDHAGVSERTASAVDGAVRQLVLEAYQRAVHLLREHRAALERVARALLERETLSGAELDHLLGT